MNIVTQLSIAHSRSCFNRNLSPFLRSSTACIVPFPGLPSPPQAPSYIVKEYYQNNVTLVLSWHPPDYGGGALVNFTITVSPALGSFTTSRTSVEVTVPYNVMHTVSIVATNCNGSSSAALETIRIGTILIT